MCAFAMLDDAIYIWTKCPCMYCINPIDCPLSFEMVHPQEMNSWLWTKDNKLYTAIAFTFGEVIETKTMLAKQNTNIQIDL